ncbi:MAG: tRNA lysidine(34) synthetase TilS [Bacteroidales bacterium]|nr:tRNA lysidine(34) synthetase TilS [Bacteroidales bacterium]
MKVLLAVSGGIDSMYMLHRAPELFPGASFAVAHCNFSLRGEESDGDEAFVRDACSRLGVECFVTRFDTIAYAAEHGVSVEMAARELRYAWFAALCSEHGFDTLATAHNANDNAETLILNLLRGTGTKGMRGIPGGPRVTDAGVASRDRGRPWPREWEGPAPAGVGGMSEAKSSGGNTCAVQPGPPLIMRPLLGTSREEIRKWMESNGRSWREDRTNAENEAKRNKIRNQVFPVFAEINPSFIRTLGADMERIRQTDDIAEDYYRDAASRIVREGNEGTMEIGVRGLLELKHWRYVLWRILEDCSFSAETFDKLCTLLERYRTEPSGTVTLSGKRFESSTHVLRARKKQLILQIREA